MALKAPSSEGVFYWYNISMPKVPTALLNDTISIQTLSGSDVDDRGLSTASYGSGTNVEAKVIELGGSIETIQFVLLSMGRIYKNQFLNIVPIYVRLDLPVTIRSGPSITIFTPRK